MADRSLWIITAAVALIQTLITGTVSTSSSCAKVDLVARSEWGARAPSTPTYIRGSVNLAFVHHSVTPDCASKSSCIARVKSIQNYHIDTQKWGDIGYSFLIGEDGRVYEGRGWGVVGAHTLNYNSKGYGFCVIGNFMNRSPNSKALTALQNIIACGVEKGKINTNYGLLGHRDVSSTSCPGDKLYALIKGWPHYRSKP